MGRKWGRETELRKQNDDDQLAEGQTNEQPATANRILSRGSNISVGGEQKDCYGES